ncbi:uncharacterized protein LOC114736915 [Neltuma alba]|uniref:uncharacterized protein LOC114736915 n=1 Tax=Neltuma alba TaxID=207710 RepID=UPI0010A505C6|nr:uncharacterized protein LOC114736915 [Prosopis alba]
MWRGNKGRYKEFVKGFSIQLSAENILEAEAWGILEGMKLCLELGFKKVEIEGDDANLIDELNTRARISGNYLLSRKIKELLGRDWTVRFLHIQREGNRRADRLAKLSRQQASLRTNWIQPPEEVGEDLQADLIGIGCFR